MITSLEIKNFKSIKALSIDLPGFAVLVGPNGSGKTNIVQAMELFGEILQRGTTDPAREQGWPQIVRRGKKPARGGITLGVTINYHRPTPDLGQGPAPRPERQLTLPNVRQVAVPSSAPAPMRPRELGITLTANLTLDGSVSDDTVRVRGEQVIAQTANGRLRVAVDEAGWHVEAGTEAQLWSLFRGQLGFPGVPWKTPEEATAGLESMFTVRPDIGEDSEYTILRILNRVRFNTLWMRSLAQACRINRFRLDASSLRSDAPHRDAAALLGPSGEGLSTAVDKLRGHGKEPAPAFRRVLLALQKVYPRIEDIRVQRIQPGRLTLLFRERGIDEDLGMMNISDGVLHALALLVMLEGGREKSATGVLAIEEPENAIHPWSVRAMMERAQASNRQVLLTTHSETVVNAVEDPGSLFIVENDDRKGTIVTPARDKERAIDAILSETGQRLGDVWMDGSLGGVPAR